jgi:di/tripeptidase
MKSFKQVTGKNAKATVCPGGLETACVSKTYPKMPKIAFGPLIKSPHSPIERMNIKTFEECYEVLKGILRAIK